MFPLLTCFSIQWDTMKRCSKFLKFWLFEKKNKIKEKKEKVYGLVKIESKHQNKKC